MATHRSRALLAFLERGYTWLLFLYPASHRHEYGLAMAQLFRDQLRDAYGQHGIRGLARTWTRTLCDLIVTVPEEHARAVAGWRWRRAPLYLFLAFAVLCLTWWAMRMPAHAALRTGKAVTSVAVSPDGRTIVAGTMFGGMHAWDASAAPQPYSFGQPAASAIYSVAFSPDGRLLASGTPCGPLGCVQVWDASTGQLLRTIREYSRGR
jgi:hypothetical protein